MLRVPDEKSPIFVIAEFANVTLWSMLSWLVQVTAVPGATVIEDGLKRRPDIVTLEVATGPLVGPVVGAVVCALLESLPPHAAITVAAAQSIIVIRVRTSYLIEIGHRIPAAESRAVVVWNPQG
jgi:hypothetical protein